MAVGRRPLHIPRCWPTLTVWKGGAFLMTTNLRLYASRFSSLPPAFVFAFALLLSAAIPQTAIAVDSLAYSFESDLQGFQANGGGTTVTQDTIGIQMAPSR